MTEFFKGPRGHTLRSEGPFLVKSRNEGVPDLTAEDGFILVRHIGYGAIYPLETEQLIPIKLPDWQKGFLRSLDWVMLGLRQEREELVGNRGSYHEVAQGVVSVSDHQNAPVAS